MKAREIKIDGSVIQVTPKDGKVFSLKELQKIVNGYIEFVYLPDNQIMVINEEGKLEKLPLNEVATLIVKRAAQKVGSTFNDFIVGDVLIVHESQIE